MGKVNFYKIFLETVMKYLWEVGWNMLKTLVYEIFFGTSYGKRKKAIDFFKIFYIFHKMVLKLSYNGPLAIVIRAPINLNKFTKVAFIWFKKANVLTFFFLR